MAATGKTARCGGILPAASWPRQEEPMRPWSAWIGAIEGRPRSARLKAALGAVLLLGASGDASPVGVLHGLGRTMAAVNGRLAAVAERWRDPSAEDRPALSTALALLRNQVAEADRQVSGLESRLGGVVEFPGGDYRSLQDALDAVPDGGTLRLAAGTYPVDTPLFV